MVNNDSGLGDVYINATTQLCFKKDSADDTSTLHRYNHHFL